MKSAPQTSYSLIRRLTNAADAEAWSEFIEIYQPLIFRLCRTKGLQYADATDLTQEVLAKVAEAVEGFEPQKQRKSFRAWLFCITRNLVTDHFRKRERQGLVQNEPALELEPTPDAQSSEAAEFRLAFKREVFRIAGQKIRRRVQSGTWHAFWETEVVGRSASDVARELQMTVGAIYVAKSRVLARFRDEVSQILNETHEQLS